MKERSLLEYLTTLELKGGITTSGNTRPKSEDIGDQYCLSCHVGSTYSVVGSLNCAGGLQSCTIALTTERGGTLLMELDVNYMAAGRSVSRTDIELFVKVPSITKTLDFFWYHLTIICQRRKIGFRGT